MKTRQLARNARRSVRVLSSSLVIALAAASVAPRAWAQAQPQAENVAAARSLGIQGIQLADAGDCRGAIEKLERAESLYHAPTILGRLGECQVHVGHVVMGSENLNRVVREPLGPTAPPAFRAAQERAQKALSAALPKIAKLTVKVEPADAKPEVTVSGTVLPAALLGIERPTDPGTHEVVVSAPGFIAQRATASLPEGSHQELTIRLEKDPNAVVPAIAPAVVTSPAPSSNPPPSTPGLDAGTKPNHTAAYLALGVGGAGLLVGGVTGLLAIGKKNGFAGCEGKTCPPDQQSDIDSAKSMATVSTIGFGVGLVGVGVGVVLLLSGGSERAQAHRQPARPHTLALSPFIGTDRVGVSGSF